MRSYDCPHCHKVFESDEGDSEIVACPHCNGTVSLPEKDLPQGTIMGGFEIIRIIGRGGMGNVYLARQISMERLVALKVLLKSLTSNKASVEQFLNEAQVSGRLNHPNIIPAIDAGEHEGTYYLATAYVEGEDLEHVLSRKFFIPENEALLIGIKIGHALSYAWESYGLLHKDIKPGNLMLDKSGEIFLMDMGIAQYIGESSGGEDHILGSPFYMSPEQTVAARLSWSSDLYSLGATLYNLVVGVPPFDAPDVVEIIEMHTTEPFPEPLSRNPTAEVTKATVEIMRKMMGKTPADRYDSWQGFIEDAQAALRAIDPKRKPRKRQKALTVNKGRRRASPSPKVPLPVAVSKSSGSATSSIFIYLLLLAIAGVAALLIQDHHKKDSSLKAIKKAECFMADHPGEYESMIELYKQAKLKSKGLPAESGLEQKIVQLTQEKELQEAMMENYRKVRVQAEMLAVKEQYDEAIKLLLDASSGIQYPHVRREVDMSIELYRRKAAAQTHGKQ
ncbi:MAG: protein kinase [Victivallales bacterium]|nr:protein kinase [Victivallales bacterium]